MYPELQFFDCVLALLETMVPDRSSFDVSMHASMSLCTTEDTGEGTTWQLLNY